MSTWLDSLLPHASPDNQLFAEEVQHIRGLRTPKALLGYTLLVTYFIGVVVVVWYVLFDGNHTYAATKLLLAVLALLSIVFALVSDINCTRLAVQSLKNQPGTGDKQQVIAARLALTEIRAWWFTGLETAFRVAFLVIVSICFLNLGYWPIGTEMNGLGSIQQHLVTLSNQLPSNFGAWGFLLAMLILIVVQFLEPVWRLRTLATLGVKQAAQDNNAQLVAGLPNIVIVWGVALFVYLVPGVFLVLTLRNALLNSLAFGLVAYSLVVGVAIWGLYDWLESSALKQINADKPTAEPTAIRPTADDKQ